MTKEQLIDYVNSGREIEFQFQGKKYSITYSPAGEEDYISFCEFYKETSDVKTVEELMQVTRNGISVIQMLESITDEDIWIY